MTRCRIALLALLALLVTGCLGTASDDATPAGNGSEASGNAEATLAVSEEGSYAARAQACSPDVGRCATPVAMEDERRFSLEPVGNVTSLELTMTWEPISPLMEELRFGVTWGCGSEQGCLGSSFVDGASPLTIELDGVDMGPDVLVWAWRTPNADEPARVYTTHEQPFLVEGEIGIVQADPAET